MRWARGQRVRKSSIFASTSTRSACDNLGCMLAVPQVDPVHETPARRLDQGRRLRARRWTGVGLCAAGLPLLTSALVVLRGEVALESVLLVYLLAVVLIAVMGGVAASVFGALASFLLANWFLTPPFHTLQVEARDRLIELIVFVVVAVLVSVTVELGARSRIRAEQQLVQREAEALTLAETERLRSTVLAAVGHDLRTPLAGIKAAVSTLRQSDLTWTPEEQDDLLGDIENATDRLTAVISNLLAMSRIHSGAVSVHLGPVALDEVVASALVSLGDVDVAVDVPEDLPAVLADVGLLERVLANLIANARRYSPPTQPATITAEWTTTDQIELSIADHGPGVSEDQRARMFEPFQTVGDRGRGEGLGMGLAIARGLAQSMGIELRPSETTGGGLTMTVFLPVAP